MTYVDAFILPVKKDQVDAYKDVARKMAPYWKSLGAPA